MSEKNETVNESAALSGITSTTLFADFLPPIKWVHRPHALRGKIEEADDLCLECCDKRIAKYRAEYPEHADEICADGGWEQCRESEGLATCDECGCDLGCYLLDTFDDVADWDDDDRCIDTPEKADKARARLAEQDNSANTKVRHGAKDQSHE